MIKAVIVPVLSAGLEKLKNILIERESAKNKSRGVIIFCEDRLTLAAEKTVCSALGGTFDVSVNTFARFLAAEKGKKDNILSAQGSAMAIRRIIENNKDKLKLFGKFSASSAASAVYDTIALLYASKISAKDLKNAAADGLLESKLSDVSLIYSLYEEYLKESGKTDRNAYLRELETVVPESVKIRHSDVIFLGYQSFSHSLTECLKAVFASAVGVTGIFIGGKEEIYVNEAVSAFEGIAAAYGGAQVEFAKGGLCPDAEILRAALFDPVSFSNAEKKRTENVHIYEAADEDEEAEFIAVNIKRQVLSEGGRYGDIAVMLPDVASAERRISRIFSQYKIPFYIDRRRPLSSHPLCSFICSYLSCVIGNCAPEDVDAVVASPLFFADREAERGTARGERDKPDRNDRDAFRNYSLRLADFRGAVIYREPDREILNKMRFDYNGVQRVRNAFLKGFEILKSGVAEGGYTKAVIALLQSFEAEKKLALLSSEFRDSAPSSSAFSAQVYSKTVAVLEEAENVLDGAYVTLNEYLKILKSGFSAAEVSLIPPKSNAVYVGDIASSANVGTDTVFAASLTDGVPKTSSDTSLLTDREINILSGVKIDISPKISQVNMRRREMTALNICSFKKKLFLIYPVRQGGEESGASEIISYASAVFRTAGGNALKAVSVRDERQNLAEYYCSERVPALKAYFADGNTAVEKVLIENGVEIPEASLSRNGKINCGEKLFISRTGGVSPTTLETYYTCPYRNFLQQGVKLSEREEGAIRPLDTGNFIHRVLQDLARNIASCKDESEADFRGRERAEQLLKTKEYSSLTGTKSGQYTAGELIKEAGKVTAGMYLQLSENNSSFKVSTTESWYSLPLGVSANGAAVRVNGKVDRVDTFGDMVRIIDYKTGNVDSSPSKYYTGVKLQLPLYLSAASGNGRAVGAYYFPASVEYKSKPDGVFRLQGYMDGSDEVVSASDKNVKPKEKSEYFDAYLSGKKLDCAMDSETFADFLKYSYLLAGQGVKEMTEGNIAPSPAEDACKYCRMGGSCDFSCGADGEERKARSVKCADIAKIAHGGGER